MIRYTRIGEPAWESLTKSMNSRQGGSKTSQEFRTSLKDLEFHQFQLDQWQQSIPEELHFSHADINDTRSTLLLTVLRLRANQMRAVMIRPFLYAGPNITAQLGKSHAAVDVASDTIQIIADLHARSDIYRRQQALFNYFLVSALGVLYALIVRETRRETSSIASDRLSPADFAQAKSGLLCGLNTLQSLGSYTTYPRRLLDRLFPFVTRLKDFEYHTPHGPEPTDYGIESVANFPAESTFNLLDQPNSLHMNPIFCSSNSSAIDRTSKSARQAYPGLDPDIANIFDTGEAYLADDVLLDTYFGQPFMNSFSDPTYIPPLPKFVALAPGTIALKGGEEGSGWPYNQ
jgi:hypothetical protein